jgi:hypothetical protein
MKPDGDKDRAFVAPNDDIAAVFLLFWIIKLMACLVKSHSRRLASRSLTRP